jgi:hypothetical protein
MLRYFSLSGLILSGILLYFKARKFRSVVYLGIFYFTVSLYGFSLYVLLYSKSVSLVSCLIVLPTFTFYLIGPMLYWYIRSTLTDNAHLNKRDFWHLIPLLVYLASALPYILTSWSYKVGIASSIVNDAGFMGTFNATVLSELFSNTTVYLSRPVLVFGYTIAAFVLFIRYIRQQINLRVLSGQYFMIRWISVFLGFQLILITSHLYAMFITFTADSYVFFGINSLQVLSALGMTGLLVSPFFFLGILYGLPRVPD